LWYDSRQMKRSISDEIADALRGELEGGRYRAGERLPSVGELRKRFGAGEFAVRAALKKLRDEGLVTLRQKAGAVVTKKATAAWKGRVAFVAIGSNASYFSRMLAQRISYGMEEAGWACSSVFLDAAHDGSIDERQLLRLLHNGVDFAIGLIWSRQIASLFDRAGVPYVVLNGFTRDFPNAAGVVRESLRDAYAKLVAALRERRVRTLLEFDYERTMDRSFKAQLADSGIDVKRVLCKFDDESRWTLADVRRIGHRAVAEYFSSESRRRKPPDAILFDDDYLADGGLVALYEAGLRVPEDVKVVFYSNKGNEPVLGVSAARIENDPVSYGDAVAQYVLKLLSGRKAAPPKVVRCFIPGKSL